MSTLSNAKPEDLIVPILERRDMKHVASRLKARDLPDHARVRLGEYKRFIGEIHACLIQRPTQAFHERAQASVVRWDGPRAVYAYRSPHREDQDFLLQQTLDAARVIPDPKDAGLLLHVMTNILHALNDANGRVSRLLYGILNDFPPDRLIPLLSQNGTPNGRTLMKQHLKPLDQIDGMIIKDMTPKHCDGFTNVMSTLEPGEVETIPLAGLHEETQSNLRDMLGETRSGALSHYQLRDLTLFSFKQAHPERTADTIEESSSDGMRYLFDAAQLLEGLSPDDATRLLEIDRATKKQFALHAIDIIKNPELHVEANGKPMKDEWYARN